MQQIKIVTDSTCDLPDSILQKFDISLVPLTVRFGCETYRDRVDISSEEFFEKLGKSKVSPSTSQVSVGEFTKVFEKLGSEHETVLGLFLSAGLSGTYQSAIIARNVLGLENIHIIHTKLTTLAHGMVVLQAAKMAREGCSLQEIMKRAAYMADNMYSLIVLGTLTYLEKGGRIGMGAALVGNLLSIMPVVTFTDGEVKFLDKIRGRKRIIKWIVNHLESLEIDLSGKIVGVNYIGGSQFIDDLKKELSSRFNIKEFVVGTVGSVIGTYSGPDMAVGVYFVK